MNSLPPDAITAAADEAYDANPPKDPPGEIENVRRIVPPPAGTEGGNEAA